MATIVHLVRHASHDLVDRVLVGRNATAALSDRGSRQAQALGRWFMPRAINAVQSSPQIRARQTAKPIADCQGLPVEDAPAVDEIDLGQWTGQTFEELEGDPLWQRWNAERGSVRPHGGESMGELQQRVVAHLDRLRQSYPDQGVVIVSHAEPIRAAVLHYAGLAVNDFMRVRVDPASVTTIRLRAGTAEIVRANECIQECVAA